MKTEQEILKNKLFGKKIQFINLPAFKDKLVIMVVTLPKSVWFIQSPIKTYHTSKGYLKTLFTD